MLGALTSTRKTSKILFLEVSKPCHVTTSLALQGGPTDECSVHSFCKRGGRNHKKGGRGSREKRMARVQAQNNAQEDHAPKAGTHVKAYNGF